MQAEGLDSFYFFRVDDFWIVDATKVLAYLRCCAMIPCDGASFSRLVCRNTIRLIASITRVIPIVTQKY